MPTSPIALPNFTFATKRSDEEAAGATPSFTPQPNAVETPSRPENGKAQEETPPRPQNGEAQEETPHQPENVEAQEETPSQPQNDETQEETPPRRERARRFAAFWRAVDVWRSTFDSETPSVTIPRGRAARYALGIVLELLVCPPCAILAAYFFTRALFADRQALYHAAMQETEKTRRTLAVGLGVVAAFLCAFIFYVQSQEIALPTETGPTSQLFKK